MTRVEAGRETGRDVGGEDGVGKENGLVAAFLDHVREHVDARLGQGLSDLGVLADPDLAGAEAPSLACERLRSLAGDDSRHIAE